MRKILFTYLPASLFLAFLAMILVSCGGGGDGSNSVRHHTPIHKIRRYNGYGSGTVAIAYDLARQRSCAGHCQRHSKNVLAECGPGPII